MCSRYFVLRNTLISIAEQCFHNADRREVFHAAARQYFTPATGRYFIPIGLHKLQQHWHEYRGQDGVDQQAKDVDAGADEGGRGHGRVDADPL